MFNTVMEQGLQQGLDLNTAKEKAVATIKASMGKFPNFAKAIAQEATASTQQGDPQQMNVQQAGGGAPPGLVGQMWNMAKQGAFQSTPGSVNQQGNEAYNKFNKMTDDSTEKWGPVISAKYSGDAAIQKALEPIMQARQQASQPGAQAPRFSTAGMVPQVPGYAPMGEPAANILKEARRLFKEKMGKDKADEMFNQLKKSLEEGGFGVEYKWNPETGQMERGNKGISDRYDEDLLKDYGDYETKVFSRIDKMGSFSFKEQNLGEIFSMLETYTTKATEAASKMPGNPYATSDAQSFFRRAEAFYKPIDWTDKLRANEYPTWRMQRASVFQTAREEYAKYLKDVEGYADKEAVTAAVRRFPDYETKKLGEFLNFYNSFLKKDENNNYVRGPDGRLAKKDNINNINESFKISKYVTDRLQSYGVKEAEEILETIKSNVPLSESQIKKIARDYYEAQRVNLNQLSAEEEEVKKNKLIELAERFGISF
jgi:hypothetical protein